MLSNMGSTHLNYCRLEICIEVLLIYTLTVLIIDLVLIATYVCALLNIEDSKTRW